MKKYKEWIPDADDDVFEDISNVKHLDEIAQGAVSKCLTCKHYCKDGARAEVTTVSDGRKPWYVGANYCTLLGFYPLKKRFPVTLNSPIGPDGHVAESPEVVQCSEYRRGDFMKMNTTIDPTPIELGYSEAELNMNETDEYFLQQLRKSSGIPYNKFADQKPIIPKTVEVPIEFGYNKEAQLPDDCNDIVEIAVGPLKFKEDVDFTRSAGSVTWMNPAFMVGPHALMTVKYTVK